MKILQVDNVEIQNLLIQQAKITAQEISDDCAEIADKNKGILFIGDIIRRLYTIDSKLEVVKDKSNGN